MFAGLLWWYLPSSLLLRVCTRLFGFEPVVSIYHHREEQCSQMRTIKPTTRNPTAPEEEEEDCLDHAYREGATGKREADANAQLFAGSTASDVLGHEDAAPTTPSDATVAADDGDKDDDDEEEEMHMRLRPIKGRLVIMGMEVQMDAVDHTDPSLSRHRAAGRLGPVATRLLSCAVAWLPSSLRGRSVSVRITRTLRRVLWLATWSVLMYVINELVITGIQVHLDPTPSTDQETYCPPASLYSFCWDDTFASRNEVFYVDCYTPGNLVPAGTSRMLCYQLKKPDWAEVGRIHAHSGMKRSHPPVGLDALLIRCMLLPMCTCLPPFSLLPARLFRDSAAPPRCLPSSLVVGCACCPGVWRWCVPCAPARSCVG